MFLSQEAMKLFEDKGHLIFTDIGLAKMFILVFWLTYGKTQMNFLANPISLYLPIFNVKHDVQQIICTQKLLSSIKENSEPPISYG